VIGPARSSARSDSPRSEPSSGALDQILRLAASRRASVVYLSPDTRASVRVDGEIQVLEAAPLFDAKELESLLTTAMPSASAEIFRGSVGTEWNAELADVGSVRCMAFRDRRGPGGVFRITPARGLTVEQLGLSVEIQSLAMETEGLILIAGPRGSGRRTLISGMLDLINRTRPTHMITVEREVSSIQESRGSFISQREARGGLDEMLAVARIALREDPDVLVLQEVRSAPLMNLALDAAAAGQLVIAGFTAHSATGAIERAVDMYPPEYSRQVQLSLAQHVRAVVGQLLLPRVNGGRVAARELLLNTSAMSAVLAEGKTWQLPLAIETGRKHNMVAMADAIAELVHSGTVAPEEAYRRAPDRAAFVEALNRLGVDTSSLRAIG
jgi:twitching motility protein PilT